MQVVSFLCTLSFLVISVASFHQPLPPRTVETRSSVTSMFATVPDSDESKSDFPTTKSDEITDLDKATFEIAKEYAKTGLPEDSEKGPDAFSIFLGCYVVFAIADSIFHFTPKEDYSTMIGNALRGATGVDN